MAAKKTTAKKTAKRRLPCQSCLPAQSSRPSASWIGLCGLLTFVSITRVLGVAGGTFRRSVWDGDALAGFGQLSGIQANHRREQFCVTATSANWSITHFACRVTLARIFTSFSRSVVSNQSFTPLRRGASPCRLWRSRPSLPKY